MKHAIFILNKSTTKPSLNLSNVKMLLTSPKATNISCAIDFTTLFVFTSCTKTKAKNQFLNSIMPNFLHFILAFQLRSQITNNMDAFGHHILGHPNKLPALHFNISIKISNNHQGGHHWSWHSWPPKQAASTTSMNYNGWNQSNLTSS
jgi:hypothetical protein